MPDLSPALFLQWHQQIMDAERIPLAIAAILITVIIGAITGPLGGNANPFTWGLADMLFGRFGDKLDKPGRPRGDLVFRGFILSAIALVLFLVLGKGAATLARAYPLYNIPEILCLSLILTAGTVWFALLRLYFALEKTDKLVEGAYFAIARTHRANLNASDDFGITRLAMGLSARTLDKGLVAPVIWYLIGGLPLAVVYSGVAALAWRFGRDGRGKGFGQVPLALERLLGFIPSLFTAALLTMASVFSPTARVGKGMLAWMGMKDRATYEQGGYPLSVLAWSLNISLGGAYQDISGEPVKGNWVGPAKATAKNNHKHLRRALIISLISHALFIVILACAYLWGVGPEIVEKSLI